MGPIPVGRAKVEQAGHRVSSIRRPAVRFHARAVQLASLSLGVADTHWSFTGAPRHPRLPHTAVAVPPEVSHVRACLAVAIGGSCAACEQHPRREDQGGESEHGQVPLDS